MGKIVTSENVSLDGVVQDPTGEEGFKFGGWFGRMSDADRGAWGALEFQEALAAGALLLGGRSYQYFATGWASRDGEWADRLRSLPKYVVSSTLADPSWVNTTILTGDVLAQVAKLRETADGDVVVYASGQLVQALLEHDLVDELRLVVHPFVLGSGERLFRETSDMKPVRLVDARTIGEGLSLLVYRPIRDA
ncbi:dihydrofolate reductase family protein [Pseudofrankia asymbiotica]|uniref:Deaminase n=1 Tax=Pseudofrankia asymbiotica TaxID=1834516 RepID=A0A1V2I5B0_9ACTN|nr:dihydrofolate reductase family protein [Pseudofrankia asymbiotica]ONH24789.1 deaminase [Pseudofrankia asymbiotica]